MGRQAKIELKLTLFELRTLKKALQETPDQKRFMEMWDRLEKAEDEYLDKYPEF